MKFSSLIYSSILLILFYSCKGDQDNDKILHKDSIDKCRPEVIYFQDNAGERAYLSVVFIDSFGLESLLDKNKLKGQRATALVSSISFSQVSYQGLKYLQTFISDNHDLLNNKIKSNKIINAVYYIDIVTDSTTVKNDFFLQDNQDLFLKYLLDMKNWLTKSVYAKEFENFIIFINSEIESIQRW